MNTTSWAILSALAAAYFFCMALAKAADMKAPQPEPKPDPEPYAAFRIILDGGIPQSCSIDLSPEAEKVLAAGGGLVSQAEWTSLP